MKNFTYALLILSLISCDNNVQSNNNNIKKKEIEKPVKKDLSSIKKDSSNKKYGASPSLNKIDRSSVLKINCEAINNIGDCDQAFIVFSNKKTDFLCTSDGYGKTLEFSENDSKNKFYFEQEHNTMWLKFKSFLDGLITFDIIPNNIEYDYDFLLYKMTEKDSCQQIINKSILPIRTNISRNNTDNFSKTGLSINAKNEFINSGVGNNYSKALKVNRGELLYLVIDNVYGGKDGFSLNFDYHVYISGEVLDQETNDHIQAEITLQNIITGEILTTAKSDPSTGKYTLDYPISLSKLNMEFQINTQAENYFFKEMKINASIIKKNKNSPVNIRLLSLKIGEKMKINNINFHGGSAKYLPSALPTLDNLVNLMKFNPKLKIQIEGHVNGCDSDIKWTQQLSNDRAESIKNYLIDHKINENRITTKGYGCSNMIYPDPQTEEENMLNRRVEILVTEN